MDDEKCIFHPSEPYKHSNEKDEDEDEDESETIILHDLEDLGEDLVKVTERPRYEYECYQGDDSDIEVVRIVENNDSDDQELSPRERSEQVEKYGNIASRVNWGGPPVKKKTVHYNEEVNQVEEVLREKLHVTKKHTVNPEVREKLELLQQRRFHRMLLPARNVQKNKFNPNLVPNSFRPKNRYGNEAKVLSRRKKLPISLKGHNSHFLYYKRKVDHQASQCNILRVIETTDAEVQATAQTNEKLVQATIHKQDGSSQYPIPKLRDRSCSTIIKTYSEEGVQAVVEQEDKAIDPPIKIFYYEDLKAHSNAEVQTEATIAIYSDDIKGYSDDWESCSSYNLEDRI
ncbi:DgyrCDS6891 [Dimorphilus gyrociliatus]|uniref:DgyrCDS6891 n=1 Tax=Dimorphilus gyrociliatus TaxID=2664684 RepID=A0A7I8VQZ4_9ANNE|nr:DgyrCDS6891 [Dimorphilus gyrociliatus]